MSEVVGEAVLVITTDDKAVKPGVDSASKNVTRGLGDAGKRGGESFSKGFTSSLKGLAGAAGLAFGVDKAVDFLKSGLDAATSFQDEVGALGVIIGKSGTDKIIKFGESSAQAFGISKVAALEAAHTFATFGKSAGLSGDDLADFSTKFTGLAGDLASFNGGSTEDAITAIGSALRGEAEPIRRYGVLLDDATLKQAALRLGIIKSTKEALTPQQKVLAAQAEIFRQTKDAQGDSARTADSAANSQKRLTAQLADLRLEIGTQLLPVATKVTQAISEFVTQMQDGTGAGGQFVDVLQQTAAVGKTVFDLIDGLPGPVKKFGAEALIAAAIASKLNSALGGIGPRVASFASNMTNAETRTARLGTAMRTAAGAGGALLLADGLQKTNTQAGQFETLLGGALSGAALGGAAGGPFGALAGAVGGAGLAFYGLTQAEKGNDVQTQINIGSYKEYETTLDGVNAKTTKQTRDLAFQRLESSGLLTATKELGLTDREAVNAVLGQESARKKLAAALATNTTLTDEQKAALLREAGAISQAKEDQLKKNVATAEGTEELKNAKKALDKLPKSKPVDINITVHDAELKQLAKNLRNLISTKEELTSGPGGFDVLLNLDSKTPGKRNQAGTANFGGGFTTVGETGPEIAWFPKGTAISTAAQSRQIAARGAQDGGVGFGSDPAVVALLQGILLATAAVGPARTAAGIGGAFNAAGLAAYRSTGQRMGVR